MHDRRQSESSRMDNTVTRVYPSKDSSCTIRIRSKNNIETFTGNVKRTISEQRATRSKKTQLKEAKKRLQTLEKLEEYRRAKMGEEVKQLEAQQILYEEHRKQELKKAKQKRKYFDMRKKQLAEAHEQKLKQLRKEERK